MNAVTGGCATVLLCCGPALGQTLAATAPPAPVADAAPGGNAGLFIGVNEFTDPSGHTPPLQFAVNDAVGSAHAFVLELNLIPPANCVLALSGEARGSRAAGELAALEAAGVRIVEARNVAILDALGVVCTAAPAGGDALLVFGGSSHGFFDSGETYLMPADGRYAALSHTALSLPFVEERIRRSHARHQILLWDACQSRVSAKGVGPGGRMTEGMSDALAEAARGTDGQILLTSCDVDQVSLELPTLGHGLFTAALLHCLRGGAADRDRDGFLRVDEIEPAMLARVEAELAVFNRGLPAEDRVRQSPTFKGPGAARRLPLAKPATDTAALVARLADLSGRGDYTPDLHARVAAALTGETADRRLRTAAERFTAGGAAFEFAVLAERLLAPGPRVITVAADGSGNERTIAAALAKVADDGRVRVLPGTYRESLVVDRPVTLEGVGPRGGVIVETNNADTLWLKAATATVRGLTLRRTKGSTGSKAGVFVTAGRPLLEDCAVMSAEEHCIVVSGAGTSPTVRGCTGNDGKEVGVFIWGGAGGIYEDCTFTGNKVSGIQISGAGTAPTFRRCAADGGEDIGMFARRGAGGSFEDCTFTGNKYAGIHVEDAETSPLVRGCAATNGETFGVLIRSGAGGEYERCTLSRNRKVGLCVLGTGTSPTVSGCSTDGGEIGMMIGRGAGGAYKICTATGAKSAGIFVTDAGTSPIVLRCVAYDGEGAGLHVNGGAAGTYEYCKFHRNKHAGIAVGDIGTSPAVNVSAADQGKGAGLFVYGGAGGTYEDCTFTGNKLSGIAVQNAGTSPTVRGCTAADGEQAGLFVSGGAGGTYEDCTFTGNTLAGISVRDAGTSPTVRGGKSTGNGFMGVWVRDGAHPTITGVNLRGNAKGPWFIDDKSTVTRSDNRE